MQASFDARSSHTPQYALDTLHALPCGCVAAVYHTQPWDVEVVALEARGPHCLNTQHESGRVLGLAMSEPDRLDR
jgi:hypothetical protein